MRVRLVCVAVLSVSLTCRSAFQWVDACPLLAEYHRQLESSTAPTLQLRGPADDAVNAPRKGDADHVRAELPRPSKSSHVHGATAAHAFAAMNRVLLAQPVRTAPCDAFAPSQLHETMRAIHSVRSPALAAMYKASDRRTLHFDNLEYKEKLWQAEAQAALVMPSHQPGGPAFNATRDGTCAELVMWWTHHLTERQRALFANVEDFVLPLMPTELAPVEARSHEYDQQIGCTSCHVAVHIPGKPPITPIPNKNSSDPQYPVTCPGNPPAVWYNRTKRCDWDYEPFCSPCEGVGGLLWGNGEHEWNPMPCEPVAAPADIPADNLTSPLWPKSFTVEEYAMLTFPGKDPCNVKFRNSTYTLYFDTRDDGPLYHTFGHTGPSGPSPFPGKSWALSNGNFYNTVDIAGKGVFCICLSAVDPVVDNAITGPLTYDFNRGAKLIGREKIKPEYIDREMIADHWVKGPHHFWIEVATGLMVREWQPFNGLQTYYGWNVTKPDPVKIDVPSWCYSGLLHHNVSCIAPPPSPSP